MASDVRRRTLLLAALVLTSLGTRWLSLAATVIDLDETCHIVGAWQLTRGGLLYTDFVDNKPPLLYVFYAAAQAIAGRGLFAVHLVTALCVIPLTALAVAAAYRYSRVGVIAAFTFVLYSAAFIGHDMLATNAEVLMILPASWAVVLMREDWTATQWRPLVSGLLLGSACLIKPHIATWIVAALAVLAVNASARSRRERLTAATILIGGAVIPTLAAVLYFQARGGLDGFVYWIGIHNLGYVDDAMPMREALTRFAAYALPFVLVTGPLWIGWWRGHALLQPRQWRLLTTALVILSVVAVFPGFRFFPHYFIQLYVPLALASAPWIERQLTPSITRAGRLTLVWTATVVIGFTVANALLYFGPFHVYHERDPIFRRVADRVASDPCARTGTLFVWGWAPMIYYFADLPPASRFVVLAPAELTTYVPGNLSSDRGETPGGREVPEHWNWLMQDLERSHATFIVDTAPANVMRWGRYPLSRYPRLQHYVDTYFTLADTIDGVDIYRRRDCRTSPGATSPY